MTPAARPTKISDEVLLAAAPAAANLRQLLLALGVRPYGGNYEIVRRRLQRLGVDDPRFTPTQRPVPIPAPALARAVACSDSWAVVARVLGVPGSVGERRAKRLALEAGLDASHFVGRAAARGRRHGGRQAQPLEVLLVRGRAVSTTSLRHRLLREGVLDRCCAVCRREAWQGAAIPLELDHVNGDRTDNRLANLRLLCPNCHAQTDTYRGRNIGAARSRRVAAAPAVTDPDRAARRLLALLRATA